MFALISDNIWTYEEPINCGIQTECASVWFCMGHWECIEGSNYINIFRMACKLCWLIWCRMKRKGQLGSFVLCSCIEQHHLWQQNKSHWEKLAILETRIQMAVEEPDFPIYFLPDSLRCSYQTNSRLHDLYIVCGKWGAYFMHNLFGMSYSVALECECVFFLSLLLGMYSLLPLFVLYSRHRFTDLSLIKDKNECCCDDENDDVEKERTYFQCSMENEDAAK